MKTILCYGDSNTWGAIPMTGLRYPEDVRWTGVAAKELGPEYRIIEAGLSGRRTVWDDPFDGYRNGLDGLGYFIHSAKPLDMVVLMLGCNDLNHTDAFGCYKGLGVLVNRLLNAQAFYPSNEKVFKDGPKILLVSPPIIHEDIAKLRPEIHLSGGHEDSLKVAAYVRRLAEENDLPWMDAAEFAQPSVPDCLHLDPEGHLRLGQAIARKIRTIL